MCNYLVSILEYYSGGIKMMEVGTGSNEKPSIHSNQGPSYIEFKLWNKLVDNFAK